MRKIKIGIVGYGHLGKHHARISSEIPEFELVGVYDNVKERVQEASQQYNITACDNLEDLIPLVDAVVIAVPATDHYKIGKIFLQAQKHVLMEKPLATSVEQAKRLTTLALEGNTILQVGHVERYTAGFKRLRELVKEPLFIEVHRLASFSPRGTDVPVVLDLMIHDIDIALSLVNDELKSVDAAGVSILTPEIDIATAKLIFKKGCIVNLTASRISLKKMRKLRVFQPGGYISLDFQDGSLNYFILKDNLPSFTKPPEFTELYDMKMEKPEPIEPLRAELTMFAESINTGSQPETDGKSATEAIKVANRVIRAINSHWQKVKANGTLDKLSTIPFYTEQFLKTKL
jgi:predicted dehydrogenase